MKLHFLGAAEEVGRSGFLVEVNGARFVLDYGIKLLRGEADSFPEEVETSKLEIKKSKYPSRVEGKIDGVIVSHAHLDHSGSVPEIFKDHKAMVYMTPPTIDLCRLLWFDTVKIAEKEGEQPRFSKQDISETTRYTIPLPFNKEIPLSNACNVNLFDAGHILGGALIKLSCGKKNLLYTGDFKNIKTRLHRGANTDVGKVDYLITESTYCYTEHPPRDLIEKEFVENVTSVLDNGGNVLCPAFAIGRSQELVDLLVEHNIEAPIYLDGMGQAAARIFFNYPEYFRDFATLKRSLDKAVWIKKKSMRKQALKEPSVIITTAGMMSGGPVMHYMPLIYNNPDSAVFLTGYQVEGTPGHTLLHTGKFPLEEKGTVDVKAKVKKFDLSAHIDRPNLIKVFKKWNPEKIFLVHGEKKSMPEFKEFIEREHGFKAFIPKKDESVSLD